MADFLFQSSPASLNSSGESSHSQNSPTDSSEQEVSYLPTKHKGKKRGEFQGAEYSLLETDEGEKKRKRAKKERTRVSNLALAYQTLARTIGLLPLVGAQKRITHEQILQGADTYITKLKQELDCLRTSHGTSHGKVVFVSGSGAPVCNPSGHYTISSNGEVLVSQQINQLDHLDLSCDETLPLPLEDSDDSSDIPMSMQGQTQTSSAPVLNYELVSPNNPSFIPDQTQIQQLVGGLHGESLVSSRFLLSNSPTILSNVPIPSYTYVGSYEEIELPAR